MITKVDGLVMESADDVVGCWKDMETDMGKVGLELGGTEDDNWFQRLEIKKKGGGFHFDDDQRALAGKAWTRLNALALLARWLGELSDKASKMVRRYSEMQANHASRGKIIKGLGEMLRDAVKTEAKIFKSESYSLDVATIRRARLPAEGLEVYRGKMRASTLALAVAALDVAVGEVKGFDKERKVTKASRANQTFAIVSQVFELIDETQSLGMIDLDSVPPPPAEGGEKKGEEDGKGGKKKKGKGKGKEGSKKKAGKQEKEQTEEEEARGEGGGDADGEDGDKKGDAAAGAAKVEAAAVATEGAKTALEEAKASSETALARVSDAETSMATAQALFDEAADGEGKEVTEVKKLKEEYKVKVTVHSNFVKEQEAATGAVAAATIVLAAAEADEAAATAELEATKRSAEEAAVAAEVGDAGETKSGEAEKVEGDDAGEKVVKVVAVERQSLKLQLEWLNAAIEERVQPMLEDDDASTEDDAV